MKYIKGLEKILKGDENVKQSRWGERATAKRMRKLTGRERGPARCRTVCSSFFICWFPHPSLRPFHLPLLLCFWSERHCTRKACFSSQVLCEWWNNIRFMHNFSVLFKSVPLLSTLFVSPINVCIMRFHSLFCHHFVKCPGSTFEQRLFNYQINTISRLICSIYHHWTFNLFLLTVSFLLLFSNHSKKRIMPLLQPMNASHKYPEIKGR